MKDYTITKKNLKILDDCYETVEIKAGNKKYVAKTYPLAKINGRKFYSCTEILSDGTRRFAYVQGKLNAIRRCIKDSECKVTI